MANSTVASERLIVLFLLGVLLFNPPFLAIFDSASQTNGIPLLYVYLFVAWAVLIILVALVIQGATVQDNSGDPDLDETGLGPQEPTGSATPMRYREEVD